MKSRALLAFILLLAAGAQAQDTLCNPEGNQAEIDVCAIQDFTAADLVLNTAYKQRMSTLDAAARSRLRIEQREWVKRRDPDCRSEAERETGGGSLLQTIYLGCKTTATTQRTEALKTWRPSTS